MRDDMDYAEVHRLMMDRNVAITTPRCVVCHKDGEVTVTQADLARWRDGAYVQQAFPELPAPLREQLVSGTHPDCFDELFGDDDEDGDR